MSQLKLLERSEADEATGARAEVKVWPQPPRSSAGKTKQSEKLFSAEPSTGLADGVGMYSASPHSDRQFSEHATLARSSALERIKFGLMILALGASGALVVWLVASKLAEQSRTNLYLRFNVSREAVHRKFTVKYKVKGEGGWSAVKTAESGEPGKCELTDGLPNNIQVEGATCDGFELLHGKTDQEWLLH